MAIHIPYCSGRKKRCSKTGVSFGILLWLQFGKKKLLHMEILWTERFKGLQSLKRESGGGRRVAMGGEKGTQSWTSIYQTSPQKQPLAKKKKKSQED